MAMRVAMAAAGLAIMKSTTSWPYTWGHKEKERGVRGGIEQSSDKTVRGGRGRSKGKGKVTHLGEVPEAALQLLAGLLLLAELLLGLLLGHLLGLELSCGTTRNKDRKRPVE